MKNFILGLIATVVLTVGGVSEAQVAPNVPDRWELSATVPGILFPTTGNAVPVKVLAGAGLQYTYLWNELQVTMPWGSGPVPVFGIGGFSMAGVALAPNSAQEGIMVGPELLLFEAVSIGCAVNLVSGGTAGLQSIAQQNFTWGNITPVVFYSIPIP
jgi:hypothetical protein